jgi:2-polyprenyl-3-methyl-5-hydroxy-6-metoxy-1,4-benzoquinol methylase
MKIKKSIIDRIKFAVGLSTGKRVLDIGGQKMAGESSGSSPFAKEYAKISKASSEYRIVDYQRQPTVDWVVDFNKAESILEIRKIISEFKPEIILCMELLEHVNYHYELMNELARSVGQNNTEVFITVPNNGNWLFNAMGWNSDHSISFLRGVAMRFVVRSDLGQYDITRYSCVGQYLPYWHIAYFAGLFQPWSWGFHIKQK